MGRVVGLIVLGLAIGGVASAQTGSGNDKSGMDALTSDQGYAFPPHEGGQAALDDFTAQQDPETQLGGRDGSLEMVGAC
jgi:hypothetical protein